MNKWKCMRCGSVLDNDDPRECPNCNAPRDKLRRVANWKRHVSGRPKRFSNEEKIKQIYDLLPEDGSKIQANELVNKAREKRISPTTLFSCLDQLAKNDQVIREIARVERKGRGAPVAVYYRRLGLPIITLLTAGESALIPGRPMLEHYLRQGSPRGRAAGVLAGIDWDIKAITEILSSALRHIAKNKMTDEKAMEYLDIVLRIYIRPSLLQLGHLIASENIDERYLKLAQHLLMDDTTQLHKYALGQQRMPPRPLRIARMIHELSNLERTKEKTKGGEKS